jgi:hypothetical protein
MCQIESGTNIHDLQRRFLLPDERFRSKIEKKSTDLLPKNRHGGQPPELRMADAGCYSPGDGSEHKVIVGEREL